MVLTAVRLLLACHYVVEDIEVTARTPERQGELSLPHASALEKASQKFEESAAPHKKYFTYRTKFRLHYGGPIHHLAPS